MLKYYSAIMFAALLWDEVTLRTFIIWHCVWIVVVFIKSVRKIANEQRDATVVTTEVAV
jgi:hypothetical protein